MIPLGAGSRIGTGTRANAVIDRYEPVDAMVRRRHEIAYQPATYNSDRGFRSVRTTRPTPGRRIDRSRHAAYDGGP
jgi:hypothetical protein